MLWASGGYKVCLYDIKQEILDAALKDIEVQLKDLSASGNLRGNLGAENQIKLLSTSTDLKECVSGAMLVQVE